jgi:hypothetical protein
MVGTEDRLVDGAPHQGARRRTMTRRDRHPAASSDDDREKTVTSGPDEIDDSEYLERFMDSLDQSVLPNLPKMSDYHVCWLTTTNPRDTIENRLRMGYELITLDMVPGFEGASPKSGGPYSNVLSVNEMLAARIPVRLFERMMRHVHHDMPLSEEEKLRAKVDSLKETAESHGAKLQEGDGMAGIVQRAKPVPFEA